MKKFKLAITICVLFLLINSIYLYGQEVQAPSQIPTIYVVGDSTASNGPDKGWGSHLGKYFDADKMKVENRARGARSSNSFQNEGLWDAILTQLKAGDYVMVQFGYNEGGTGTLPGLGEETKEVKTFFSQEPILMHTFGWYMRKYISDTRAKGATPIILSMTVANYWRDGKVMRGGEHNKLAGEVARDKNVTFIDLNKILADEYEKLGQEKVKAFFPPQDNVHTSPEGADFNARMIVSASKQIFGKHLSEQGKNIPQYENKANDTQAQSSDAIDTTGWAFRDQPKPNLPTLFIIGDSTVRANMGNGSIRNQWGWANPIAFYFDRSKINVENRAMGGTSSETFRTIGLWDKVLTDIKPGDFVIMQFGHNDAGSIRGTGDETREVENPFTKKLETVHSFGWNMKQFIITAKEKGASSIVCSMIPRNNWRNGKLDRISETYGKWAKEVADAEDALFIDLNNIIAYHYEKEGQAAVTAKYFEPGEGTHTNAAGAELNARCVIDGLKKLKDCPLNKYLSSKADDIK